VLMAASWRREEPIRRSAVALTESVPLATRAGDGFSRARRPLGHRVPGGCTRYVGGFVKVGMADLRSLGSENLIAFDQPWQVYCVIRGVAGNGRPAHLGGGKERGTDAKREGPSHGSDGPSRFTSGALCAALSGRVRFPIRSPGAIRPQEHTGATVCAQRRVKGITDRPPPILSPATRKTATGNPPGFSQSRSRPARCASEPTELPLLIEPLGERQAAMLVGWAGCQRMRHVALGFSAQGLHNSSASTEARSVAGWDRLDR